MENGPVRWHAVDSALAMQRLRTPVAGLTQEEVARRLELSGLNVLPAPPGRSSLRRLLDQFNNMLIYILLVAAGFTALLEHWVDTAVIIGVVIINALVGFVQEGKAERAMDAIRDMIAPRCTVLRDGVKVSVPARDITPGDIVLLEAGDRVPADLRLLTSRNLQIDESALTGESVPVGKSTAAVAEQTTVADRSCIAWAGTLVQTGTATGLVIETGPRTELGRISEMLVGVDTLMTPLMRQIRGFGHTLSIAIVVLAVLTFAFGVLVHDYSSQEMFLAAVSFAVAAIPEGLPAIITITLALGVQAMAQQNAIVRRLPAVETLGSVTVICSDKTGTLTRNEMMVASVMTEGSAWNVDGTGYVPEGRLVPEGETDPGMLEALLRCGVLCNDATIVFDPEPSITGDPTEAALLVVAHKAGMDVDALQRAWPRIDSHPFESERRYMASLHRDENGCHLLLLKGAPEAVLARCDKVSTCDGPRPLDKDTWVAAIERMAGAGQRTLALAQVEPAEADGLVDDDPGTAFTLLGIVGMIDPPRAEAIDSVRDCHDAGIMVKMITGDHAATASAIAHQLGITRSPGETAMDGNALDRLDSDGLRAASNEVHVFARVSPAHKLKLVEALQADGAVVAMTGDGVNDAPALRRADVGVAMGRKGTEVAREASEIILTDDNFATIAAAVAEGRRIYDNIRKAIMFVLPTNAGEALTVMVAILLGRSLPLTPVQVLWVNMVTAVTLALALVFEQPERDVMKRPPREPGTPILTPMLVQRTMFVGALMLGATFGMFVWERALGSGIETARTMAVNTLVMCEVFYLLACRCLTSPVTPVNAFRGNPWILRSIVAVLALQALFTYWAPMQRTFGTAPLDADAWLRCILAGFAVLLIVESEKGLRRHFRRKD